MYDGAILLLLFLHLLSQLVRYESTHTTSLYYFWKLSTPIQSHGQWANCEPCKNHLLIFYFFACCSSLQ